MKPKPIPDQYDILKAVTFDGEPLKFLVTCNGFQIGGETDESGAGNLTFESYQAALNYILTLTNNPN